MADPGQVSNAVPPGVAEVQRLQAAGFHDDEIAQQVRADTVKLQSASFTPKEIASYWGADDPQSVSMGWQQPGATRAVCR